MPASAAAAGQASASRFDLAPRPAQLAAERLGDRPRRRRRRAAAAPPGARAGCGAGARRRRVRACSSRAAITTSASRSGRPATIGAASFGSSRASVEHRARRVPVAEGELGERLLPHPLGRLEVLRPRLHPERDLGGVAGRLAALALDQPVDGLLRHPPPGGELAAGDRQHPRRGLVELGLARDVDRLLRVAGRDQRPHAGVGADQVGRGRARCRRRR